MVVLLLSRVFVRAEEFEFAVQNGAFMICFKLHTDPPTTSSVSIWYPNLRLKLLIYLG